LGGRQFGNEQEQVPIGYFVYQFLRSIIMVKKMFLAAAILLVLGVFSLASTVDIIPNFPSPYPFTEFSDTDTVALWLFDDANYKNTTLTDASPYEKQPNNHHPPLQGCPGCR
jgi:hypothetical protein